MIDPKTEHRRISFRERNRRSQGYLLKRRAGEIAVSIVRAVLLTGLCFMIIQPLLTRFFKSVMTSEDLFDNTVILLPRHLTLDNYKLVFELTDMPVSLLNTIWICLLISTCQVLCGTLVAYAFARFEYPLKKLWMMFVVFLIIIPPQTLQVPLYLNFMNYDIFGVFKAVLGHPLALHGSLVPYTLMSLTCMGIKNGILMFILMEFFKGMPVSLEEAAYVDGCGIGRTFVRIMLPDAFPVLASCFLFSFVWQWTDIFYTTNFLSGYTTYSSAMNGLRGRILGYYAETAGGAAGSVAGARIQQLTAISVLICCVPLLVLYCFTQKTFVQSIMMTGSKE